MLRKVFWNIPNSTQPDDIKWKEDILPAAHIHQSASSFLVTMVWEKLKKTTYTPSSPSINDNIWLRVAQERDICPGPHHSLCILSGKSFSLLSLVLSIFFTARKTAN